MESAYIYFTVGISVLTLAASFLGGTFWLGVKFSRIHEDIRGLKDGLHDIRQELKRMNIFENRLVTIEEKARHLENGRQ